MATANEANGANISKSPNRASITMGANGANRSMRDLLQPNL